MSRTRILVAEDETIVALDIKSCLEDLGYEVLGVTDRADEALKLAAAARPDLVLMDIRLKGEMDGIAAAEQIRRRWGIPIVFLTAFSEESTLQRARAAEPLGYIIKPFDDRELQAVIAKALGDKQGD
jgi:CheY-like chemotaxis protein